MRAAETQLDIPIHHCPENPAGRKYRNIQDGKLWTVELEIGGAVWLSDPDGNTHQCALTELETLLWERQHP